MPIISMNPLLWDWSRFARITLSRNHARAPYISDKIARDIGMDPNDLAELLRQWPSESKDRPLI